MTVRKGHLSDRLVFIERLTSTMVYSFGLSWPVRLASPCQQTSKSSANATWGNSRREIYSRWQSKTHHQNPSWNNYQTRDRSCMPKNLCCFEWVWKRQWWLGLNQTEHGLHCYGSGSWRLGAKTGHFEREEGLTHVDNSVVTAGGGKEYKGLSGNGKVQQKLNKWRISLGKVASRF